LLEGVLQESVARAIEGAEKVKNRINLALVPRAFSETWAILPSLCLIAGVSLNRAERRDKAAPP
jgi:hypothetical protein